MDRTHKEIIDTLCDVQTRKMTVKKGVDAILSLLSMTLEVEDNCEPCNGTGYVRHHAEGLPPTSDCVRCYGTGKSHRPLTEEEYDRLTLDGKSVRRKE